MIIFYKIISNKTRRSEINWKLNWESQCKWNHNEKNNKQTEDRFYLNVTKLTENKMDENGI